MESSQIEHFDVIIVGAGLSGIDAAYHMKTHFPNKTFVVLESRESIGGTWDLFKYPGIRSDSDMYTFSYYFKPWTNKNAIGSGESILEYLKEAVEDHKLNEHIRFQHKALRSDWSSDAKKWTIKGINGATNESFEMSCQFAFLCTGYYDYENGYTPDFQGLENFNGEFVHPQKWTKDIQHKDKEVVIIGSGATAVTLGPTLAEEAKKVTILQRTPSYILSRPKEDKWIKMAHAIMPSKWAHNVARWKYIRISIFFYNISKKRPKGVRKFIKNEIRKVLGSDYDIDKHFSPDYNPWDQRLCAVPDNDLFHSIQSGKLEMVTDHIDQFTQNGIQLKSGKELPADLVVSATGLQLKIAGGMEIYMDDKLVDFSKLINYKGVMMSGMPNAAFVIGYTNASWTLKADLTCRYIMRLLKHMDDHTYSVCTPRLKSEVETKPIIDFSSGYISRALDILPKQGDEFPWRLHQNYLKDNKILGKGEIEDGFLEFG